MNNKAAIRPWIGTHKKLGPDIIASGWDQRYSTPYVLPVNPPNSDYYHGPTYPMMDMRGRHPFRTQPRGGGLYDSLPSDPARYMNRDRASSLVTNDPYYSHGMGAAGLDIGTGTWQSLLAAAGHIAFAAAALLALK